MSVRHALLALLREGPKYGLQLQHEFEAGTGEVWPLNDGQVYGTLQRLERAGLIESADTGGPQRVYALTEAGADELTTWLETPPGMSSPPRDELVIKVLIALRLTDIDATELVQVHRRKLVESMQQYTRLKDVGSDDEIGFGLAVDAELFRLDGLVRWLDAVDGRLERLPARPAALAPQVVSAPERLRRRKARQ